MKNFMTKMLTLVLALVLVISPMAVFAEEGVTYEMGAALEVGTKTYDVCGLAYTVYTFDPTEVGKYTISSSDSVLGIVSYTGMWVTVEPSAETITQNSFVWECTSVGQSIWVAALSKDGGVSISVEKEHIEIITQETRYYENKVKPTAFTFDGDATKLEYVDIEDGKKDVAALGKDGYYHLGDANGPRLFTILNDTMMSFYAMREPGQLSAIVKKPDGTVDYKVDYNAAFDEYWACVASVTLDDGTAASIYPLTDDLIVMIKNVAGHHGWFKEGGWLSDVDPEDGWMFPCVYIAGESFEGNELESGPVTDEDFKDQIIDEGGKGGVDENAATTSPVTNNNTSVKPGASAEANNGTAHQTGDNAVYLFAVIAGVVVAGVIVVLSVRKKKNTISF